MKGKIFLALFALPFAGIGLWMAFAIGSNLLESWQMRDWVAVEGRLTRAGYETRSGEDSDSYRAYAEYSYTWGGRTYRNDRVAIDGGADNVGDYQRNLAGRLERAMSRNDPIVIHVDPHDPSASVIDREVRWGLLGFRAIFVFVFGGFGLALLVYLFRSAPARDPSAPEYRDRPWLANDGWQTEIIASNSKTSMYVAWGFAAMWNLVSAPLPFMVHREVTVSQNYPALLGLLFPVIGAGLVIWAIRRTLEWRRFGAAPLSLDPFPGAIGGHVGGTIDLRLPYTSDARFTVALTNVYSYMSGSGKDRKRSERAKWQDSGIARAEIGSQGTRLSFRFDVPPDLAPSEAVPDGDAWHSWRLSLSADIPGIDINRDYEIPVYPTSEKSRHLSDATVRSLDAERERVDEQAISTMVRLDFGTGGRRLLFPAGRNLPGGLGALLFGAVFGGSAWFLVARADHPVFGGVFGFFGLLIGTFGLYQCLNSLEVIRDGMCLRTVRRIMGVTVRRREMLHDDFARFDKSSSAQSQSGGRHTMYYSVYAVDRNGERMVIGEGFRGAGQADAAMRMFTREFGLPAGESPSRQAHTADRFAAAGS